jgi:HK97 family phage major capsid protein
MKNLLNGSRPRALIGTVRADASDPKALITQLNGAFEEFKNTNEEQLKSKVDDVLFNTKLDAINNAISDVEAALNEKIATAALNAAPGDMKPTDPAYLNAFKAHMRKGAGAGPEVMAAVSVGTATDGGYLAPVEWDRTITNKLKQISPRLSRSARTGSVASITTA